MDYQTDTMLYNDIGRIVGGCFIALCNALSAEGVEIACDTLRGFADNPNFNPEVRRVFAVIANIPDEELNRLMTDLYGPRPRRLDVVSGGAA